MKEWKSKVLEAALLLLLIALVGRIIWGFLHPLVPLLMILVGLAVVYGIVLRHWH